MLILSGCNFIEAMEDHNDITLTINYTNEKIDNLKDIMGTTNNISSFQIRFFKNRIVLNMSCDKNFDKDGDAIMHYIPSNNEKFEKIKSLFPEELQKK